MSIPQTTPSSRHRWFASPLAIAKASYHLFRRVPDRLRSAFRQSHALVFSRSIDSHPPPPSTAGNITVSRTGDSGHTPDIPDRLHVMQISPSDEVDIDELTRIDEWRTSKSATLQHLRNGWRCYAVKLDGEIVASSWAILNPTFRDAHLNRDFSLAPHQAYHFRSFCVPKCRGQGIMPFLYDYVIRDVGATDKRTEHMAIVRATNGRMIQALSKLGWSCVGRLGFVEIMGIRFHYLSSNAFKYTHRRCFLQVSSKKT